MNTLWKNMTCLKNEIELQLLIFFISQIWNSKWAVSSTQKEKKFHVGKFTCDFNKQGIEATKLAIRHRGILFWDELTYQIKITNECSFEN